MQRSPISSAKAAYKCVESVNIKIATVEYPFPIDWLIDWLIDFYVNK